MKLGSANHVVVTGGAGFVGKYLIRSLLSQGVRVSSVVFSGQDEARFLETGFGVPLTIVENGDQVGAAVRAIAPTHVVHLGAVLDNRPTEDAFSRTLVSNFLSTVYLMQSLISSDVERVILMGSCEEYGRNETPFAVDKAVDPPTPYAASKAAVTAYARMFYHAFGLETVVLRPSVVYGLGQNPRMLISDVMGSLLKGESVAVTLGEQQRDFLYIDDLVRAIEQALVTPGVGGQTLNIGSGRVNTVRECIEKIASLVGKPGLVNWGGREYSKNETFRYCPDCSGTMECLQWEPRFNLQMGLRQMFEEMRYSIPVVKVGT